jgi:hypothetical protein
VTSLPFKFDKIGYWSELKLEIVEKYGAAYTKTFVGTPQPQKILHRRFQRRRRSRLKKDQGRHRGQSGAR